MAVVSANRGEKGEKKDFGAGRLAGRPAGKQAKERRRRGRCALPVPYDRVYERLTSRPARSAMLFPNLNSSSRVSSLERKVNHHLAAAARERRYVTLPYLA